jgi:hypothetical protein
MPSKLGFSRIPAAALLIALLALTTVVLGPALSGGFLFDDYPVFVENPVIHVHGWHWQAWLSVWTWSHDNIQRPLAMLSYAFNYSLGGSTWGFKALNLTVHLLNSVLVWLFVRYLLAAAWPAGTTETRVQKLRLTNYWAFGIAAAWATHPLQVSAVMYVVQRMELLGFTFTLLGLLVYWHARANQQAGKRAWPWFVLCGLVMCIGYLAKETLVLLPGYTLLLELTLLRFATLQPSATRKLKIIYAAGCVTAGLVIIGYLLPHYAAPINYTERNFTAWQRELTQLRVLPMYLGWCLCPLPSQLHFYYDNYAASTGLLSPPSTLLGGLLILGLLALAIVMRKRRPLLALGIGWFFVAHALTSSPIALELVFEHRNYPALLGVLLAAADLLWLAIYRLRFRIAAVLAMIFIISLCFQTILRAATWGNPLQLGLELTQDNPGSPRADLDLARRYLAMSGDNPNVPLYDMGIKELERAAALSSSSITPEELLLIQSANHSGLNSQPWWESIKQKLQYRSMGPETYLALNSLLQARLGNNVNIDVQQLSQAYAIAISRNPGRVSLHVDDAELDFFGLHDPSLAAQQWKQALTLQKDPARYAYDVVTYLIKSHRNDEALLVIDQAQALNPALRDDKTLTDLRKKIPRSPTTPE